MATPTVQSSYSSADGTIYYDLTDKTGDSAQINGALFFQSKPDSSSGTGLIQAIVRVQDPGNGDGFENGYNTSFRPLSYEENTSPSFTTSLLLAEVPIVTINGTAYYEFRLDINQLSGSSSLLSLDEIKLYKSAVGDGQAQGTIGGSWFTSNATLVYDMDGAGQSSVLLDAANSSGSGSSDMFFYVPVSNFGASDPTDTYVTLYSEFGGAGVLDSADALVARDDPANANLNYNGSDAADNASVIQGSYFANDGFEEWSVSKQKGGEITGYKFADLNGNGVWDNGEGGLGGWTFDYTISYDEGKGNNIQHVVVTGQATTSDGTVDVDGDGVIDPVGFYAINVPASSDRHETYTITITEELKAGYVNSYDGDATADGTTTFTFSSADLTTTGSPPSPNISGHFGVTETMNFGNFLPAPAISITKDASVPGGCADTVGELVTYTVTLHNTGNVTLQNVVLTDSFEGGSDATLTVTGDSNSNGVLDAGEVWLSGDANSNGLMETTETWTYTYAHAVTQGDIDSNGGDNDGTLDNVATVNADGVVGGAVTEVSDDASVDVCQNPALDITKDADVPGGCADTVGELVTYTVTLENTGNVSLDNVVLKDSFEGGSDVTLTVTGDSNSNGVLDAGEVWLSGDTGNDGVMNPGETWTYTYAHAVTQGDIDSNGGDNDGTLDNVATASAKAVTSGDSTGDVSDDASVDVCQNPALSITKDASVPSDCADVAGENITYTVVLGNTGNVALDNVVLTDSFEGGSGVTITPTGDSNSNGTLDPGEVWLSGDTGNDGIMSVGETWTYTYLHTVTQAEINSNGVDGDASLDNVATANATALNSGTAADAVSDDAAVAVCQNPGVDLTKYVDVDPTTVPPLASDAHWDDANSALGPQDVNLGTDVWFKVTVENTGNVDLTNVDIVDVNKTLGLPGVSFDLMQNGALTADAVNNHGAVLTGDTDSDGVLDVGETWTIIYSQAFDPGDHFNTATVTDDQNVTDSDDAHYYSLINLGPCPRTPGFWQNPNNGGQFWDNISGNEKHVGQPDFPAGELIYPVDSNHDGFITGADQVGLLIGDYNHDGFTDNGEDTLFISYADARTLINANNKQLGDGKFMLGRDMVAVWLNFLAGVSIGDASDTQSPKHYLNDAINWMQIYAGNTSGGNSETFDSFKLAGAVKPSAAIYNTVQSGFDHSASQMHTALDYFDNTGQTQPGGTIYANCDSNDFLQAVTLYETTHNVLV